MGKDRQITVFKIRIINISLGKITFDLYVADRVDDTTYLNVKRVGGYRKGMFMLESKQFSDFAQRLIAFIYLDDEFYMTDNNLKSLWGLKLNIFDKESPKKSNSIFIEHKSKLKKIGLTR